MSEAQMSEIAATHCGTVKWRSVKTTADMLIKCCYFGHKKSPVPKRLWLGMPGAIVNYDHGFKTMG